MANPALTNHANGTTTGTSLTISHTAETGKVVYYVIFADLNVVGTVSATYGGNAMTFVYKGTGDVSGNPRGCLVFSYAGASAGAANAVLTSSVSREWHGVTFNVSDGPVNGVPVLMACRMSDDTGTYNRVAPGWDAEGACVAIGYRRVGGITSLTSSGSTTHANNGNTIVASVSTSGSEHTWAFLAGGVANMLLTFLIPNGSQVVSGGTKQVLFSGRTSATTLAAGSELDLGGIPYAHAPGNASINVIPQSGTIRAIAVKLLNGALGGSNAARYELRIHGGLYETPASSTGVPISGASVSLGAADTEASVSGLSFAAYKYLKIGLHLVNTGSAAISPLASVSVLMEGAAGEEGAQFYGGGVSAAASNTVDELAAISPLSPAGFSTTPTTHETLIGINCTITELVGEATSIVTASPDRDFYLQKHTSGSWVTQDGAGGTVDTKATLLANTTLNAVGRKTFSLACVPGDRIRTIVYRRTGGSTGEYGAHIRVVATTPGYFMIAGASAVSGDAAVYPAARGDDSVVTASESQIEAVVPVIAGAGIMQILGVVGRVESAPGILNTWDFKTRKNLAASAFPDMSFRVNTTDTAGGTENYVAGDNLSCLWDVSGGTTTRQWWCYGAFIDHEGTALQRITQIAIVYAIDEYADEEPPPVEDPCTGGGTVASGSNPSDGTALTTATALHAWIETTIGGTTYRWAKVGINHGNPKTPRVLSFGKLTTALSDDNGGFESASMRILLSDYDRTLRGLHVTQTLMNQSVSVYVADEATIRAGGNPWRVFRGVVRDFRPESELKYRITIEDPLTLAMSAFSQEKLVPSMLTSIIDGTADQGLRQTPAPWLYGSLSEEGGAIELPFIGTQTPIGHADLGNRHRHLIGLNAIGNITAVFRADPLSGDPPTQRSAALESEYEEDILAPHISPGWYEPENYLVIDDHRWTILDLEQTHPAADLARYGRIPLTANVCGIETTGDGTGATINSLPRQALHYLNNDVAQTTGDENWNAIATRDSYALFDTASFETVKTVSEGRIAGGYRGAFVLGHSFKQITLRELLRQLSLSGNFDFGINRHGQIMITMLDRTADTSSLTHFTDQSDILKDSFSIDPRLDAIENRVRYAYRRNYVKALQQQDEPEGTRLPREPFDKTWLSDIQTLDNTTEQTNLGEVRESKLLELEMVRDEDVADDIAAQRLALRSPSNGRAEASFDVTLGRGHSLELGDLVKVTHFQGLGASGWSANVCQVRRREVDLDRFTLTFTVRDVDDLMGEDEVSGLVVGGNPITIDGDPIVLS